MSVDSRNFTEVRGRQVRHVTLQRDWVCGRCGSRLITKAAPWRTECRQDPSHSPDGFVHKQSWDLWHRIRQFEALEVMAGLPEEWLKTVEIW